MGVLDLCLSLCNYKSSIKSTITGLQPCHFFFFFNKDLNLINLCSVSQGTGFSPA